jgi:hypothetical protein
MPELIPVLGYPDGSQYAFLKPIGNIGVKLPLALSSVKDRCVPSYEEYGIRLNRDVTYRGVAGTAHNVWRSIKKMDNPSGINILPEYQALWKKAVNIWKERWTILFADCQATRHVEMTTNTSATFPFQVMGFRYKADVLQQPEFWTDYVYGYRDHLAIWRVCSKEEFLSMLLITNGKIRTFIIPPLHLLYWQKVLFSEMSEVIKSMRYDGVAYGIVFSGGGFDNLMKRFEGCAQIYCDDVEGWDRLLPLLPLVYELKKHVLERNMKIAFEPYRDVCDWTIENTVNSTILLPNGDLIQKAWGNNSGSGQTTEDNCLAHDLIKTFMALVMERELKVDMDYVLYSDDAIDGISPGSEKFMPLKHKLYSQFYMGLKAGASVVTTSPHGAQFLGATAVRIDHHGQQVYVPAYDSDRIFSALVMELKRHQKDEQLTKLYSLMILSWNDVELFNHIRDFLVWFVSRNTNIGFARTLLKLGIPTRKSVIKFWLGVEQSGTGSFFYGSGWREVDENLLSEVFHLWALKFDIGS